MRRVLLASLLVLSATVLAADAQREYRPQLAVPDSMQPFLKRLDPANDDGFPLERQAKELDARLKELSDAFRANPDQFDAAISDMTMPLLSGLDVIRELRTIRPDLPVALTSGRASMHSSVADLGIDTWISKPTTLDELARALEFLLQKGRERKPLQ